MNETVLSPADDTRLTNRLAEAEPLMRRALTIDEASYGENHPWFRQIRTAENGGQKYIGACW